MADNAGNIILWRAFQKGAPRMPAFVGLEWGVAFNTQISHHLEMQTRDFEVGLHMSLSVSPTPIRFHIHINPFFLVFKRV